MEADQRAVVLEEKRAAAQKRDRAQLVVRCVSERERRATFKEWDKRIAENGTYNARRDVAAQWLTKHCARGTNPVIETREFVDRSGFVRVGRVVVDHAALTVCPSSTPPSVVEFAELQQEPGRFVGDWPLDIAAPRVAVPFRDTPPLDPKCAEFDAPTAAP